MEQNFTAFRGGERVCVCVLATSHPTDEGSFLACVHWQQLWDLCSFCFVQTLVF
ncbi:hypothetical protein, unlikely [Trypanosoma brucei brucei TREU927]|uniref:Uncharacterized protein n=1 Tax=Trypanosoma brucei brucei (strain 927/4 GUTat10.1) TaxID=185431 RepID=Q38FJ0_TRYB2|nr:hypothetical protein, unlikely [Trypanosoma brucei brucei TREU927]EAN76430.1 hypothetical protein, unlikely [Trypanosoma brucei brucei TREU927]